MPFTYNGATFTAHEMTIGEEEDASEIALVVAGGKELLNKFLWFGQYQVATTVDGDEPLPRVTASSSEADIHAAYAAWRRLPGSFRDAWLTEIRGVERAVKNG